MLRLLSVLALIGVSVGCPQNLGSCLCRPSPIPGVPPTLDCSGVSDPIDFQFIDGLQQRPPPHFAQIVIRRSSLAELPNDAFGVAHADQYLIENNPNLEAIFPGAFGANANPTHLKIRNNPLLEELPFEDFKGFSNLVSAVLNDNRLLEVPDFALDGVSTNLKEIMLQRNVILDCGRNAFTNLPNLEILDMSENQLAEIGPGCLHFSVAPNRLNLAGNKIVGLDVNAFGDPNVPGTGAMAKQIDLSSNSFRSLPYFPMESIFRRLDALKRMTDPPMSTTPLPLPPNPFTAPPTTSLPAAPAGPVVPTPVSTPAPSTGGSSGGSSAGDLAALLSGGGGSGQNALLIQLLRQALLGNNAQPASAPEPSTTPEPTTTTTTTTQAPVTSSQAPAEATATEDPIFKLRMELLKAISLHPAGAKAAGKAVIAAAEAATAADPAVTEPTPAEVLPADAAASNNVIRRKRQAPNPLLQQLLASLSPANPAVSQTNLVQPAPSNVPKIPQYTVNLSFNPLQCTCDIKWIYDLRIIFADQIFGTVCQENGMNLFTLPETHFIQC